jgi:hypothetical protein
MKPEKPIILLIEGFLTCMAIFGQVNSSSTPNHAEIARAALQSARSYATTLNGTKPPGSEYGEYEIPAQFWSDSIKELNPVRVYDHLLNVAIVLTIQGGEEEGLYITNPISSYAPFVGFLDPNGFDFERGDEQGPFEFRRHKAPRFEDYPVTGIFTSTPTSPKIVASSQLDMEKIRNGVEKGWGVFHGDTEKPGANFAGNFILIRWSCGTQCLAMAIVDAKNGNVFSPPDTSNCNVSFNLLHNLSYPGQNPQIPEVQFRADSNLLVIKSNPGFPKLAYASYYLWHENKWTLLRRVPLQSTNSDATGG